MVCPVLGRIISVIKWDAAHLPAPGNQTHLLAPLLKIVDAPTAAWQVNDHGLGERANDSDETDAAEHRPHLCAVFSGLSRRIRFGLFASGF